MKTILIAFILITASACATTDTAIKTNESLQLMDGSYLFIESGKAVRIVDSTGEPVSVKKGAMMELASGNFIYIKQDRSVTKIDTGAHETGADGHSHSH